MVNCEDCRRSADTITGLRAIIRRMKRRKLKPNFLQFKKPGWSLTDATITSLSEAARRSAPAGPTSGLEGINLPPPPIWIDEFVVRDIGEPAVLMRLYVGRLIVVNSSLCKVVRFTRNAFGVWFAQFNQIPSFHFHVIETFSDNVRFLMEGQYIELNPGILNPPTAEGDLGRLMYEARLTPEGVRWYGVSWCIPAPPNTLRPV